ncbi:MAG: rhomboid family intramembrane serine protease [Candidatus Hydrogenedentes bacterium]|nr:rhomboid family intramembrane serine protease [Candidatus Hydrogenedentota bacterium]
MTQRFHYREPLQFGGPRITWGVRWLILINVLVFIGQLLINIPFGSVASPLGGRINEFLAFQPDLFLKGFLYKPLTYQFLHSSLMHLFMNMLWLFFFGPDVERTLGSRPFVIFFVLCGALGVLTNVATFALFGTAPSIVGASGAAMGVLIAFAIIDPERQFFLFPLPFPINARALVLIVVVLNVITGLGENNNTSVATHFGGMAVGYLYMTFLPRYNAWWRQYRHEKAAARKKRKLDKVGQAVDNIFEFRDRNRK